MSSVNAGAEALQPSGVSSPESDRTFVVHFSDPSAWARLRASPTTHWKLIGRGEICVSPDRLVLRGFQPRILRTGAARVIQIALSDVVNVIQVKSVVQFYVFAGLSGSVASLLWSSGVNSAGASGAIFGVIGGLLAFMANPQTQIPRSVATAQRNSALVFVCYNLFNGFAHAGIDNACHIGGLAGGFAMGWFLARPVDREHREDPGTQFAVASLVGLLALVGVSWPLFHPSPAKVAEYLDQKRFGLDLLSDAARYNDPDKLAWANQVLASNEQRKRAVQSLIRSRIN